MGTMKPIDNTKNVEEEFTERDPLREDAKPKEISFREKIIDVFANITLEPCLLLFVMTVMIEATTSQNLILEKACRVNLNFTKEICDSLKVQDASSQNVYEKESQKLMASALTWRTYLTTSIPCILALLVGSFSDRTGYRKVFVLVPIIGQTLVAINNIFNVYFFYQLKLEAFIFSAAIIEGICGGWCVCFLTAYAFISSITSEVNRTFRMGLMSFSVTVGFPLGMGVSGILLKKFGYYGCYGLATGMHTLNFLYVTILIKDPEKNKEQIKNISKGLGHIFRLFFDLSNVKETLSLLVKKAPRHRRLRLCILLTVVSVIFGPMFGEISVLYMLTRYRFNWDEVDFSIFQTYNFVTHTLGTIFSILVFSKYLQWHDSLLGIVSTLSKIAASFVYCFAPNARVFYVAPLVEILNGTTSFLALRSIITKLVEPNELGKVNSLIGLVENLMPLLYVPLYTKVYTATMEVLPGTVFLMGAGMQLPAVIVLFYLFYEHRKQVRKLKKMSNNQMD